MSVNVTKGSVAISAESTHMRFADGNGREAYSITNLASATLAVIRVMNVSVDAFVAALREEAAR